MGVRLMAAFKDDQNYEFNTINHGQLTSYFPLTVSIRQGGCDAENGLN